MSIRASHIVLNYNGWSVLRPCLHSLHAAMSAEDEIIVVDNGSSDGSVDHVAREFPFARLVPLPNNTYIFGLNEGLAVASGRYVSFLNNDMTVEPSFVDQSLAMFDADDIFAVCPRILDRNAGEQGSRTRGFWKRGLLFYQALPHSEIPTDCFFAVGGQSFFDREKLLEIGSIDQLLRPMYHEDIELSYRAWKRGWRIRYAPDAVAHHLGGVTSKRVFTAVELRSFVRQNELLTVWKNITDYRLLAEHVLCCLPRLLAAVVRRDTGTLRGFGQALHRLPEVRRRRRLARCHSRLSDREVLRRVGMIN